MSATTEERAGFVHDLDERTYHADTTSLSVSGAKTLLKAPALFRWQQDNPVHKDVFDIGTAAHKLVLGVGADIAVHEYDADKVKSPKSTKAWKDQQAEVRAAGGVLLLPDEWDNVRAMADKLSEHSLAMQLLSDGQPEVSAYGTDERTGVLRRARYDWLRDDLIVDFKTAWSIQPHDLKRAFASYGYHQQHAWYLDLARDLGHGARSFVFIVQMKEPPYLVGLFELQAHDVERGRELNDRALERFRDCTESGVWPGFYPTDAITHLTLPAWAHYDNEESA